MIDGRESDAEITTAKHEDHLGNVVLHSTLKLIVCNIGFGEKKRPARPKTVEVEVPRIRPGGGSKYFGWSGSRGSNSTPKLLANYKEKEQGGPNIFTRL